jgi:catechol-2,3-dioxygenase
MRLNHLHLHTRDRADSEAFYQKWLRMSVARKGDRLTFMSDGAGFDLALMDDSAPATLPAWFHFGFRLENASAVVELFDSMMRAGVSMRKALYQDETLVSFRCADPDGYALEIYWEEDGAALD